MKAPLPDHIPSRGNPQILRPEIKRIIEALAASIVAREDMEAAARAADERPAA